MNIFDHIRKQISKKRKPPQKRYKPTQRDLELLEFIKIHLEHGISVIIQPPPKHIIERINYENAKAFKQAHALSDIETLIQTGYWIRDDTNG
jgi:hypothetical protein